MSAAKESDLSLLGNSGAAFPESPDEAILETFANHNAERKYWIKLDCKEFSSLCPVTGQPDYARIRIEYIPAKLCVETKSLKFYLASFRSTRAFNEEIVNRIADDFIKVCSPRQLHVYGDFAQRGGIALSVEASYPDHE